MNDIDKIIKWQMEKIEGHARLLQEHATDPTCSCEVDLTSCVRKHCLLLEFYASETLPMVQDERLAGLLNDLSIEAREMKEKVAASVCGNGSAELDLAEVAQFGRTWAKRVETGYTCPVKEVAMSSNPGKEPWQMTLRQYAIEKGARPDWAKAGYGETYRFHKRAVKRAVSEGKPVPTEVLADYPELAGSSNLGNPSIGESLVTGAGIGAGLVVGQKVLEKKEGNPIALSPCEKQHKLGPRLNSCIRKGEERNVDKGCPPMGKGTKKCPNPAAICRTRISIPVCGRLTELESPKVHSTDPLMDEISRQVDSAKHKEHGFAICSGKSGLLRGPESIGRRHGVTLNISCPKGSEPIGTYHSHPSDPNLSEQDKTEMVRLGLPVACVGVPHSGVRCYMMSRCQ